MPIYTAIDNFLANYPNETDFWKFCQQNLTQKRMAENPALDSLQIGIEVWQTNSLPYDGATIVSIA